MTRRGFFKALATAFVAGKTLPLLASEVKPRIKKTVVDIGRRMTFRRYAAMPPSITPLVDGIVPTPATLAEYYDVQLLHRYRKPLLFCSEFKKISEVT